MQYTANLFALTSPGTGRQIGAALLCVEATYASVCWEESQELEHLHSIPWHTVAQQLNEGLTTDKLDPFSPIAFQLSGNRGLDVHCLYALTLSAGSPAQLVPVLDGVLKQVITAGATRAS